MPKRRISLVAAAASLALVASCAGGGETGEDNDNVIRIGAAISETGAYSAEGASVKHGYEYWASKVNDAGGLDVGGDKRPVELIFRDDQSRPETAIKLIQSLISGDRVDFLFGPYSSGLTLATSAIAEQYETIMFAGAGSASAIFRSGNTYIFSPLSPTPQYSISALNLLSEQDIKTVAVLHTDEAPMVEGFETARQYASEVGIDVVATQSIPSDSTDVRGAMRQLQAANPDALMVFATSVIGSLVVKTQQELDWSLPTVVSPAAGEAAFVETLGAATARDILGPSQWEAGVIYEDNFFGTAEDFADGFNDRFGEPPTYLSASAAAAAYSLQLAVEAVDSTETAAVQQGLYDLEADTFFGHIDYADAEDDSGLLGANVDKPMVMIQLGESGERTIVAPAETAAAAYRPFTPWNER